MDPTGRSATSAGSKDDELPRPGDVVAGKYRIDGVIGAGGMGVVMGALDTSLGRPVAVKFLAPARARREGAVPRFVREARAAASLQGEHVVRVFEVGTLPTGTPFIVMEQLRGADLSQIVGARGALPTEEAVDYLLQACEALGEAHGRGIVHRDLKPQNLFLAQRPDGSPCLKILDFGISKAIDEEAPNLTATDAVMGTPLYMSPEQVRSLKNVDLRSDIWALGSILFELLTGSPIFEAPSVTALCAMIAMDPPIPLRVRRPLAPAELEAVILRCLEKDPNRRFQNASALADALAPFASERGRQSALRVSHIVRASSPNQGLAGSFAPGDLVASTMDAFGRMSPAVGVYGAPPGPGGHPAPLVGPGPSNFPAAPAFSASPPGMTPPSLPGTQDSWQQISADRMRIGELPRARVTSPALVILGGLMGLLSVGALGGAGYYFWKQTGVASTRSPDSGGAPGAVAPASSDAPVAPFVTTTSPATPTGSVASTGSAPSPATAPTGRPSANRDAGAPAPPGRKDAGAPAPSASASPPQMSEADEIAVQKRQAENSCVLHRSNLSRNDAKTNDQAKRVKWMLCPKSQSLSPNSGASNCERALCRQACAMLQDQDCLRQVDYAAAHNPLRY